MVLVSKSILILLLINLVGCSNYNKQEIIFDKVQESNQSIISKVDNLLEIKSIQTIQFEMDFLDKADYLFFANNHYTYMENSYIYFLNQDNKSIGEIEINYSGFRDSVFIDNHLYLLVNNYLIDINFDTYEAKILKTHGVVMKVYKFGKKYLMIVGIGGNSQNACSFDEGLENMDCIVVGKTTKNNYSLALYENDYYQFVTNIKNETTDIFRVTDNNSELINTVNGRYGTPFLYGGNLILDGKGKYYDFTNNKEYPHQIELEKYYLESDGSELLLRYGTKDNKAYIIRDYLTTTGLESEILLENSDYVNVIPFATNVNKNITIPVFKNENGNVRLAFDIESRMLYDEELSCSFQNGDDQFVFGAYKY